MDDESILESYQELVEYLEWTDEDSRRVRALAPLLEPCLPEVVDDFYAAIVRHTGTRRILTGGPAQIDRLRQTLRTWLLQLLSGQYDRNYVLSRWRVGYRHVEIGLPQVFTHVALGRLRMNLVRCTQQRWDGPQEGLFDAVRSLDKRLDLDLAIIEEAYQAEHMARLQATDRLVALGQLAGGLAHELRNPLNVIKTSVYCLIHAPEPEPEVAAEHLRRIERQVDLADEVITALSSFAKLPVPNLRPTPVAALVAATLEASPPPDPAIAVVQDLPEGLPGVLVDPGQVRIVLDNLIRNAYEAMPQGGQLRIIARSQGDTVEMDVQDTGIGIAPADLARIMEPFITTKSRGLGLGLAMSQAILQRNRASLSARSAPGVGSTFTVHLTAVKPEAEAEAERMKEEGGRMKEEG